MSLYDVIGDITQRQCAKTETGDTRVYGVMVGIVAKNYHAQMGGRVCVVIPTRDGQANELQWARLAMPSSGKKWGHYFLPEVGDQVLLAFEGGNIEKPYVIGCVPKDNNGFLTGSVDAQNQYKRIVTKHGSTITFEDSAVSDDGSLDKITIQTAGEAHTLLLDNAGKSIKITDKDGKNSVVLTTAEGAGTVTIQAANSLTIRVGQTIKLTMNGDSGTVDLTAQQVTVEGTNRVSAKTDGMLKLEGAQISETASAMHKVDCSGMVKIGGSPIKLG